MAEVFGDHTDNHLIGTEEDDTIGGGPGHDTLEGLGGNDLYFLTDTSPVLGYDLVIEQPGGGTDTIVVQRDVNGPFGTTYALAQNVEDGIVFGPDAFDLVGNSGNNSLSGNEVGNRLIGSFGDDALNGAGGFDSLEGGDGDDTYLLLDANLVEPVLTERFGRAAASPLAVTRYDSVIELANVGSGIDTVIVQRATAGAVTLTSYALDTNVENAVVSGAGGFDLFGNGLANALTGNDDINRLVGGLGDDTLNGAGGLDRLEGGAGDDTYVLGDVIRTEPVTRYDAVIEAAGGGTDTVLVQRATAPGGFTLTNYTLGANIENGAAFGTEALDLNGNALGNALTGNDAAGRVAGGAGDDTLNGGGAVDTLLGGAGDDVYVLGDVTITFDPVLGFVSRYDTVVEALSGGTDTILVERSPFATTPTEYTLGANIENGTVIGSGAFDIVGNALANALTGNDTLNVLSGGGGADTLNGAGGFDTLEGGTGDDLYLLLDVTRRLVTGPSGSFFQSFYDVVVEPMSGGFDTVVVQRAEDVGVVATAYTLTANIQNGIVFGADAFDLTGNELANALAGNDAANSLDGGDGNDSIAGAGGRDTLAGGDGNDVLDGGADEDLLAGGPGNDTLDGGDAVDTATYGGSAAVAVSLAIAGTQNTLGAGVDLLFGVENLVGGSGNDSLTGSAGANLLRGGAGRDTLAGGIGNDTLAGGLGKDALTGNAGGDRFDFNSPGEAGLGADSDVIVGFSRTEGDRIDLFDIDANDGVSGNQAFAFIGAAAFSAPGQLRAFVSGGTTIVQGNVDADVAAEFQILLAGGPAVNAADFAL